MFLNSCIHGCGVHVVAPRSSRGLVNSGRWRSRVFVPTANKVLALPAIWASSAEAWRPRGASRRHPRPQPLCHVVGNGARLILITRCTPSWPTPPRGRCRHGRRRRSRRSRLPRSLSPQPARVLPRLRPPWQSLLLLPCSPAPHPPRSRWHSHLPWQSRRQVLGPRVRVSISPAPLLPPPRWASSAEGASVCGSRPAAVPPSRRGRGCGDHNAVAASVLHSSSLFPRPSGSKCLLEWLSVLFRFLWDQKLGVSLKNGQGLGKNKKSLGSRASF